MSYHYRLSEEKDLPHIWEIIQQAINRRKAEGSNQWQDGYPNMDNIKNDLFKKAGFVLTFNEKIVGYFAIFINDEPAYHNIEGQWLTNEDFVVVHRVAIHDDYLGRGLALKIFQKIEEYAHSKNIFSIKVDTNFDNLPMLHIFEKLKYVYCGQVYFRDSARRAFEKVLSQN